MTGSSLKVVFAGGGTGGHVIPAIAVAIEVVRSGGSVRFIGSADRLEARLVPSAGFGIDFIKVKPLVGVGATGFVLGLASVPAAVLKAGLLIRRLRPSVVLGVGGYVAGPVVLAARLLGVPSAVLEQNASVGLTNKILARVVDRAFVTYEETLDAFGADKVEVTGNPVKHAFVDASRNIEKKSGGPVFIVVMGGSQGAKAIDERVPAALMSAGFKSEVKVLHQCSKENKESVSSAYKKAGIRADVLPFIDDMATVYSQADLVVARSGATTVAELTAVGLPAVFLPYPHHSDRQQFRNAEPMVKAGAAIVLDEKETGIREMKEAIEGFVRDGRQRAEAALASASLGRPLAAQTIAKGLEALARGRA